MPPGCQMPPGFWIMPPGCQMPPGFRIMPPGCQMPPGFVNIPPGYLILKLGYVIYLNIGLKIKTFKIKDYKLNFSYLDKKLKLYQGCDILL
jgi:hypothetical protein